MVNYHGAYRGLMLICKQVGLLWVTSDMHGYRQDVDIYGVDCQSIAVYEMLDASSGIITAIDHTHVGWGPWTAR